MVADYYDMLGVPSSADRATIENALAKAQPVWSAGTRNPKNKHTFQSYLDQIPLIRRTLLGDPSLRAAYDAELAESRRADRDRLLDRLQRLVKIRAAKGGLTVSDRDLLRSEATSLGLANGDFDRLAAPYPPMPEAPIHNEAAEPAPDVIEAATRRQIRIALDHLRRQDLYEVLNLPRDAPLKEIVSRADSERQKWMQKSQVTAEKTAWLEAVSYAQSHLTNPETRARYDRTLVLEAEETFLETIQFAVKGTTSLASATRQFLREEALGHGIAGDRADLLIDRACRSQGVSRDGSNTPIRASGIVRYLRCRSCSGLTEYALASRSDDSAYCRHCRASLQWKCPVCQRTRWVDEPRCACGFRLEHAEPLVRYFEAANHAHRVRDLDGALEALRRVQEFAPQHIGARKGIERIKETQAEIDRAKSQFELERSRHHLISARDWLATWGRLVDPSLPELRKAMLQINELLRDARVLAAKAKTIAESDPSAARDLFRRALGICGDLPEALEGLKICPPEPPTDLRAEFQVDRVRLRWTGPPPDGQGPFAYRILRKRGAVPSHSQDGTNLAEVAIYEYEDASVTSGDTVGYAVFAVRGGISSVSGAAFGPIPVLAEVGLLRLEAQSQEIHLSWEPPPNCVDVRVVRKTNSAPSSMDDGDVIPSLRGQAIDRNLEDDRVYHYGVFAIYRANDTRLVGSRGAFVSGMPTAPIATIVEPSLSRHEHGPVRVSWTIPARGKVVVFRSSRPIPHPPGDHITRKVADALDGIWLTRSADDHALDRRPPDLGICHYTAMISWAGQFTVGRSAAFSNVPDPSDLRAVRSGKGGKVLLRWRWSPRGGKVRVLYRAGAFPSGPDDPLAHSVMVEEGEFSRLGYFPLVLPPHEEGPWHVSVITVAGVDGQEIVSPGLDPSSRTVVPGPHAEVFVSYSVRAPGLFGKTWTVQFRTEPSGSVIPPTVLVAHPRTVPLSADDGETVAAFPASHDGEQFTIRTKADLSAHRLRIFTDPHSAPDGQTPIRLRHPEAEGTRV